MTGWKEWKDVANKNRISYRTFRQRVQRNGWPPKRAATTPVRKERSDRKWIEIARKNGIGLNTYIKRVDRHGWDLEEAATTPPRIVNKRSDRHWIKIAKENGIERNTYTNRVDNHFWDEEEAATTPVMSREEISKLCQDARREYAELAYERIDNDPDNLFKLTPRLIEIAQERGISETLVRNRVYTFGWTVEEAITKPPQKGFQQMEGYKEWREIALNNGLSDDSFYSRVKRGWDLERAALTKEIKPGQRRVYSQERIDKAKRNGISYYLYANRISRGWTEEEASSVPVLPRGKYLNEERKEKSLEAFKKHKGNL